MVEQFEEDFDSKLSEYQGNRESWLTELAGKVEIFFSGFRIGKYRVTCGWPCIGGLGRKGRRIGECHSPKNSKAGFHEIFISPVLEKALEVAGTLTHELAHVAAGVEAKHGKGFVRVCNHVGLTKGKPTSIMPGKDLDDKLREVIKELGMYPHYALTGGRIINPREAGIVSLECILCNCRVTIGKKMLLQAGYPTCGCGTIFTIRDKE